MLTSKSLETRICARGTKRGLVLVGAMPASRAARSSLLSHLPRAEIIALLLFLKQPLPKASLSTTTGTCCRMEAAGNDPAASLPASSRPLRRPRPPNAHTSDFLEAHTESSQSQKGLLRDSLVFYRWRRAKSFYSKLSSCFWLETQLQGHRFGVFPDFLCFTHKKAFLQIKQNALLLVF